jgi:uncharacterized repeat protein (TIGR01451 family)
MLSYALKDLLRNKRRSAAAAAGVALAVGLVSGIAFFVDSSSAQMTARALAPVAIDMQAGLKNPLASTLALTETLTPVPPLSVGQVVTVSITATNSAAAPATNVVLKDTMLPQFAYVAGSTRVGSAPAPDVAPPGDPTALSTPLAGGLSLGTLAPGAGAALTYEVRLAAALPPGAINLAATASSDQTPAPTAANAPIGLDLARLQRQVRAVKGVVGVEPMALVDLPAGSLRAPSAVVNQPVKLLAVSPDYGRLFPLIAIGAVAPTAGTALTTPATADLLAITPGQSLQLAIPGRAAPLELKPVGVADLSRSPRHMSW